MNLLNITFLLVVSFLSIKGGQAQTSLRLEDGGRVCSKNTLITFKGLDFYNEGEFIQDSSTLLFSSLGDQQNLQLLGEGKFSLYNLVLQMGGNSLIMGSDLEIKNILSLSEGNLDLHTHKLLLASGKARIEGEREQNRILGDGTIEKKVDLNFPQHLTPGNLGIEITAEGNLGETVIKRIQKLDTEDSLALIHRQYEVETSFLPASPIQLSLNYLQTENPFGKDVQLTPMEEQENSWSEMAYYQSTQKANTLDVLLTEAKRSWHIGLSPAKTLVESRKEKVTTDFQLYPNPFEGFVFLQWEEKEEVPVEFQLFNAVGLMVYSQKLAFQAQEILLEGIPDLPEGVYVAKILTSKGNSASRSLIHKK